MAKRELTSEQKAKAWTIVAGLAEWDAINVGHDYNGMPISEPVLAHICDVIVPSLRRRADIIRRNGKRR